MLLLGCTKVTKLKVTRQDFPNVLDIKNIPQKNVDWDSFFFSDQGAWFGFALPSAKDRGYYGSFVGPFFMDQQKWFSQTGLKLKIYDKTSNIEIALKDCEKPEIIYYPGMLLQKYYLKEYLIKLKLIFATENSAIVNVRVINKTEQNRNIELVWQGETWLENAKLSKEQQGISYTFANSNSVFEIESPEATANINIQDASYRIEKNYEIAKARQIDNNLIISYHPASKVKEKLNSAQIATYFANNKERWNGYINKVLAKKTKWLKEKKYQTVAVKALETLILNWRSAKDDLKHDGLFPSATVDYFNGFWAWDSWKHAVALAHFAPELAKEQILTMYDYQNEKGMIADCIYENKADNNCRNSKPPLSAWAIWEIYKLTRDEKFLNEIFPKVKKYHEWWFKFRDHDKNGLCEYGSTDGTVIAGKWESGMDNAIRFDSSKIVNNTRNAYSLNQESVDLNSYLYAEKIYLAKIADILNDFAYFEILQDESETLKNKIHNQMFDKNTGYFYDIKLNNNEKLKTQGPSGWIPLWAEVATPTQADQVQKIMADTSKFNTYYPLPTVSRDNPEFSTGYWRGTVWLDQAYFGIKALRNYGYDQLADQMVKKLLDNAEGLTSQGPTIRENYWSLDGKAMRVHNFSWSAAHFLMLLWER